MIIGAMVSGTIVYSLSVPTWLRLVVYVLDVAVAICGSGLSISLPDSQ